MTDPPGRLIGSGRAADVYDLGDGTVLRRNREARFDVEREAEVMRYVRSQGFPVPEVYSAAGTDLVMERIEGRTMMSILGDAPVKVVSFGRLLARLQALLAEIVAPDWLMAPGWEADPRGDRVLHLDLHPMNVMIAPTGPVLIDWTNAAGGPPGFDAALSSVVMQTFEVTEIKERIGQQVLVRSFQRARGRRMLEPYMAAACDHRLADPGVTPEERVAVAALRTRVRDRA